MNSVTDAFSSMMGLAKTNVPPTPNAAVAQTGGRRRKGTRKGRKARKQTRKNRKQSRRNRH
jgi:hypothetical protein